MRFDPQEPAFHPPEVPPDFLLELIEPLDEPRMTFGDHPHVRAKALPHNVEVAAGLLRGAPDQGLDLLQPPSGHLVGERAIHGTTLYPVAVHVNPYPAGYRSSAIEEPFSHRVDLGDAGVGQRVEAGLHLRHGTEGLGGQALGIGEGGVGQPRARMYLVDQP